MAISPDRDDFLELEKHFGIAKAAIGETSWESGYPKYPDEVWALSTYIQHSPWCDSDYKPSKITSIFQRISEAAMDDVRIILTGYSRGERFCDGYFSSLFADK